MATESSHKAKITPKDFFLWAGAMVTLYVSTFSFIALLFIYIDYAFPNVLRYQPDPYASGLPYQMASLIVLTPVFLVIMRLIRRAIEDDASRYDVWIRRWSLVLTLFAAGATMVIDVIVLLNQFLSGQELTLGFILKTLIVFLVAGALFLHFLADIRGYWKARPDYARLIGIGVGIMIIIAIVSGFFIVGTPHDARLARFDTERTNDLSSIQWQIVNYWQSKEMLPETLAKLEDPISGFEAPTDPQTGEPYTYKKTGTLTFTLCAVFSRESFRFGEENTARPSAELLKENWEHGTGEVCFEREIDPELYPVREPTPVR